MSIAETHSKLRTVRVHGRTVAGMLVLWSILTACGGADDSPEQELRDWVTRGEQAAEEKDRSALLKMISADYQDARGNDRKKIGDTLRAYFLYQNSIVLLTSIDAINVSGGTAATVAVTVGTAETRSTGLGFDADAYNFEFELVKPDDDWLLLAARWSVLGREPR